MTQKIVVAMEPSRVQRFLVFPMSPDDSFGFPPDALFEVELRVARRADELARTHRAESAANSECWLQAEREILGDAANGASSDSRPLAAQPSAGDGRT